MLFLFYFWPVSSSCQCCLSQLTHQILPTNIGRARRRQSVPTILTEAVASCPRHMQSVFNLIVDCLMDIHVMVNWQLSQRVSADTCHLTVSQAHASVQTHWGAFFKKNLLKASVWFSKGKLAPGKFQRTKEFPIKGPEVIVSKLYSRKF